MHNIPFCCFCHTDLEKILEQTDTPTRDRIEQTDDNADDKDSGEDDKGIIHELLTGGPNDLLQLALHLAKPLGELFAGTDEEIRLLVSFCHFVSSFRLLRFGMNGMLSAEPAILLHFQTVGVVLLVFHGVVVSLLAFVASECNLDSHCSAPP